MKSDIELIHHYKEDFMNTFISHCEADTISLAKKLASKLSSKDIVVLTGDLGSGKTKFTRRFA